MGSGTVNTRRLNTVFSSDFLEGYLDRHTPDKGRSVQQPKRCADNKNEDNSSHVNSVNNDNPLILEILTMQITTSLRLCGNEN